VQKGFSRVEEFDDTSSDISLCITLNNGHISIDTAYSLDPSLPDAAAISYLASSDISRTNSQLSRIFSPPDRVPHFTSSSSPTSADSDRVGPDSPVSDLTSPPLIPAPIIDRTSHIPPATKPPIKAKKYKPVALKTRPIIGELPGKFRIIRDIVGDPLATMPKLPTEPPTFAPCGRYTQEHKDIFDKNNAGFLLPEERKLMHYFMMLHQDAFAWNDTERGHFREDFFPPVDIPVVPHTPWVLRNIPIPPGIYDEVCKIIRKKLNAGTFEPSNSSYRSRWFCVVKKDGKSLCIVQSLEPLNQVMIQHSGVPPFTEQLAEHFAARACGSMLDLYVGYDERALAESSRDYTTFQTPFGALCLTTLPMGWTNSVPIFHEDVTHILQPEVPHITIPYIDDIPVRGPASRYILPTGEPETIPENPRIRHFVWEHFQDLNRVVQRMKYSGGTFSGVKTFLAAQEITVTGHRCTIDSRLPDQSRVSKLVNWGPCRDLSDVRAFLGTMGVCRLFIRNFAHRAHHLVKLTRKGAEWEFGPKQIDAMNDLKDTLLKSPALRPLDYKSDAPIILSVDTSQTNTLLAERYWWPTMGQDVTWFVMTCHLCQLRRTQQISIPPIVATPAPLFAPVACTFVNNPSASVDRPLCTVPRILLQCYCNWLSNLL
jgi:hypothetical protein